MDVDVEQQRARRGMRYLQAELPAAPRSAASSGLAGVDVSSGLHPDAETLVAVQDCAAA